MYPALWIAKTGLDAEQTRMATISNNLANVNTTGFKRDRAVFEDLIYQNVRQVGASSTETTELPSGLTIGTACARSPRRSSTPRGTSSRPTTPSTSAVQGAGFFQISHPDGTVVYTRDGSFSLDQDGQIVTANGYALEPSMTVPRTRFR